MDKTNQKILFVSFAALGALSGITLHLLIVAFANAFSIIAKLSGSDLFRHGFPVVTGFLIFLLLQLNSKVRVWGDEVIIEIRKVVWPTRKDITAMTIVVCIMVLISGVVVTSFDLISGYVISQLMNLK